MKSVWIAIALIALFGPPLTQASGVQAETAPEKSVEKPWDHVFENGFKTPYAHETSEEGRLLHTRWVKCSMMVGKTNMVANTVASVKENPDDYYVSEAQNKKQLEELFPTNKGTYEDTLNAKILDLGYKHWKLGRGEDISSPKLSRIAWEWCTNQSAENFIDL